MHISIAKTKVMFVRAQDPVSKTTADEAGAVNKHVCCCGFKFLSRRGKLVHEGRCKWPNEFDIDKILDCAGEVHKRKYKVTCEVG